ncbi:MAG: polyprenyl synthetase family protein [Clostridia bacterium]|nr:polyprenyl synthetase family protein [Clostridia bacterium]MBN2882032.1 polyprenyl synthetase family protein [Clostridia bacterium]
MSRDIFREKLDYYSKICTGFIVDYLDSRKLEGKIKEAMYYSLSGGKHLRPALMMGTFSIFSKESLDKVLPFAAAIEMIHTYSLIHDDLPAMDDDDLRRGRASSHKKFGEAIAILAGDALLNTAAECMLENISENDIRGLNAALIIMKAAGAEGMIGGQSLDISGVRTEKELQRMYSMKTGALLLASAAAGAVLGGCSKADERHIHNFAESAGYAFQVKDDLLDVYGNKYIIGKPTGSDQRNSKVTMVSLLGEARAVELVKENAVNALTELDKIKEDAWFLRELMTFIVNREG